MGSSSEAVSKEAFKEQQFLSVRYAWIRLRNCYKLHPIAEWLSMRSAISQVIIYLQVGGHCFGLLPLN